MGCSGSQQRPTATDPVTSPPAARPADTVERVPVTEADLAGTFKVTIVKTGEADPIGATVSFQDPRTLTLAVLKDAGLFATWNANHGNEPDIQLREGDQIWTVNGVMGDNDAIYEELKTVGTKEMLVKHVDDAKQGMPAETVANDAAPAEIPVAAVKEVEEPVEREKEKEIEEPAEEPVAAEPEKVEQKELDKALEGDQDIQEAAPADPATTTDPSPALTTVDEVRTREPDEAKPEAPKGNCSCF